MEITLLDENPDLKSNLKGVCRKVSSLSQAESELGSKFEYTDKFINFIVEKSFKAAPDLGNIGHIMYNLVLERKHALIINCSKAADIMLSGALAEYPLVMDYDEKRGTLLKYNNRTLNKYIEVNVFENNITNIRNQVVENISTVSLKNK